MPEEIELLTETRSSQDHRKFLGLQQTVGIREAALDGCQQIWLACGDIGRELAKPLNFIYKAFKSGLQLTEKAFMAPLDAMVDKQTTKQIIKPLITYREKHPKIWRGLVLGAQLFGFASGLLAAGSIITLLGTSLPVLLLSGYVLLLSAWINYQFASSALTNTGLAIFNWRSEFLEYNSTDVQNVYLQIETTRQELTAALQVPNITTKQKKTIENHFSDKFNILYRKLAKRHAAIDAQSSVEDIRVEEIRKMSAHISKQTKLRTMLEYEYSKGNLSQEQYDREVEQQAESNNRDFRDVCLRSRLRLAHAFGFRAIKQNFAFHNKKEKFNEILRSGKRRISYRKGVLLFVFAALAAAVAGITYSSIGYVSTASLFAKLTFLACLAPLGQPIACGFMIIMAATISLLMFNVIAKAIKQFDPLDWVLFKTNMRFIMSQLLETGRIGSLSVWQYIGKQLAYLLLYVFALMGLHGLLGHAKNTFSLFLQQATGMSLTTISPISWIAIWVVALAVQLYFVITALSDCIAEFTEKKTPMATIDNDDKLAIPDSLRHQNHNTLSAKANISLLGYALNRVLILPIVLSLKLIANLLRAAFNPRLVNAVGCGMAALGGVSIGGVASSTAATLNTYAIMMSGETPLPISLDPKSGISSDQKLGIFQFLNQNYPRDKAVDILPQQEETNVAGNDTQKNQKPSIQQPLLYQKVCFQATVKCTDSDNTIFHRVGSRSFWIPLAERNEENMSLEDLEKIEEVTIQSMLIEPMSVLSYAPVPANTAGV